MTLKLRSAFSRDLERITQKEIVFIIDPDAYRQPRNIQINTTGRRVDITWEPPYSPGGLLNYYVRIGDEEFYVPSEKMNFSWYAARTASGTSYNINVGAAYLDSVKFENVLNFNVVGNSIEHQDSVNASAISEQQLTQENWNNLPIGGKWVTTFTFDSDPDDIGFNECGIHPAPNILLNNTPAGIAFCEFNYSPAFRLTGLGISSGIEHKGKGTKCTFYLC